MAIPWVQVCSNLVTHPKTYALADQLKLSCAGVNPNIVATGMLVGIWSWAAQNAPDGDITSCSARVLADAAGWRRKPEILLSALLAIRWIDERPDGSRALHDWEEYASLYIDMVEQQKRKTKERVQRYRDRKRQHGQDEKPADVTPPQLEKDTPCYAGCNVTDTPCNASTEPNLTIPYQTLEKPNSFSKQPACAHDAERMALAGYFEENCHQVRSMALLGAFERALFSGCEADMLRAVIDDVSLIGPRSPAQYLVKILDSLKAEGIHTVSAYQTRRDGKRQAGRGGSTQPAGSGLADNWEQEWLEEVKRRRAMGDGKP